MKLEISVSQYLYSHAHEISILHAKHGKSYCDLSLRCTRKVKSPSVRNVIPVATLCHITAISIAKKRCYVLWCAREDPATSFTVHSPMNGGKINVFWCATCFALIKISGRNLLARCLPGIPDFVHPGFIRQDTDVVHRREHERVVLIFVPF